MKCIIWIDPKNIIHHKVCKIWKNKNSFVLFFHLCSIMFKFLTCFQVCRRILCWRNCSNFTGYSLRHVFQVFRVLSPCTVHLKALSVCIQFYTFLLSLGRPWPILQEELAGLVFEVSKHCCRDWLLKEGGTVPPVSGFQSSLISNISRKQIILVTWLISSG